VVAKPRVTFCNTDGICLLRPHDVKPLEANGPLYRWSKGQISHVTASIVPEDLELYSSTTLVRLPNGQYFATPIDATSHYGHIWNRLAFSTALSNESFKFLDYNEEPIPPPALAVPDNTELQSRGNSTEPITRALSGRIELALACIDLSTSLPEKSRLSSYARPPWRFTRWRLDSLIHSRIPHRECS